MTAEQGSPTTNTSGDGRPAQRQRTKGWRMPEGAVYVGRPSQRHIADLPASLSLFMLVKDGPRELPKRPDVDTWLAPLRGRDLACWCPVGDPCHADVLLELANR